MQVTKAAHAIAIVVGLGTIITPLLMMMQLHHCNDPSHHIPLSFLELMLIWLSFLATGVWLFRGDRDTPSL